jgi:hypothetical protein
MEKETLINDDEVIIIVNGNEWHQKKIYSDEDMIEFAHFYFKEEFNSTMQTFKSTNEVLQEWKQFKNK